MSRRARGLFLAAALSGIGLAALLLLRPPSPESTEPDAPPDQRESEPITATMPDPPSARSPSIRPPMPEAPPPRLPAREAARSPLPATRGAVPLEPGHTLRAWGPALAFTGYEQMEMSADITRDFAAREGLSEERTVQLLRAVGNLYGTVGNARGAMKHGHMSPQEGRQAIAEATLVAEERVRELLGEEQGTELREEIVSAYAP